VGGWKESTSEGKRAMVTVEAIAAVQPQRRGNERLQQRRGPPRAGLGMRSPFTPGHHRLFHALETMRSTARVDPGD
jgi:hypothetical protein